MTDERLAEIERQFQESFPCPFPRDAGLELLAEVRRLKGNDRYKMLLPPCQVSPTLPIVQRVNKDQETG
jgi:hypothetical protein